MKDEKSINIIFANDITDRRENLKFNAKIANHIDGIKISLPIILTEGIKFFEEIKKIIPDKKLIFDLKLSDIGFKNKGIWEGTNSKIIKVISNIGITHITAHAFPGKESLEEIIEVSHENKIKVFTLPMMTPPSAHLFFKNKLDIILLLGECINIDGYIGPANKLDILKKYRSYTKKPIWCPGFGRQGGNITEIDKWIKIVGKNSGMILGSIIYKNKYPEKLLEKIRKTIDKSIEK